MINKLDPQDRWLIERHAMFTASLIYKILPTGKDGKGFSATGMAYIEEKAIEKETELYERPELEFVESLLHGKYYEEPAFKEYVRVSKNYSMRHFGSEKPLFLTYNEYSGGSPDGLQGEGERIDWGCEIKCPKNSKNHFKYLKFKDQWDLREHRIEYYSQIQFLLMITQAKGFHFVSYDARWKDPNLRLKILDVFPDQKFQDNLEIRLQLAQKEKMKLIQQLKSMQ